MYRQVWLAVVIGIVLVLGACLPASLRHARDAAESQLAIKNADSAAALALSLSQIAVDPITVELAVSALFDTGHYEQIRIVDPFGKILIDRSAPPEAGAFPKWFPRYLPIRTMEGEAQITRGWDQFGTLTLISHRGAAHDALWHGATVLVAALLCAGVVLGLIGTLIVRRNRQSLDLLLRHARAIGKQHVFIDDRSLVPQLRPLAATLNATASRVKIIFDEHDLRLDAVRREAHRDPLTGLSNRIHFMAQLQQSLETGNGVGGLLLMIHLADLSDINLRLGRPTTDDFLKRCGEVIGRYARRGTDGIAARLDGADFAVMLPGAVAGRPAAEQLLADLVSTATPFGNGKAVAAISFGRFEPGIDLGALLSRLDCALSSAKRERRNALREADPEKRDGNAPPAHLPCAAIAGCALDNQCASILSFPHHRIFRHAPTAALPGIATAQQKG